MRQIYNHYAPRAEQPEPPYRYCPHCAAELVPRPVGGRVRQSCPQCRFVHFANPAPAIVVLVLRPAPPQAPLEVLLGLRTGSPGAGKWALPSGYIEYDDDFLSAGRREVFEETGLQVRITAVHNVLSSFMAAHYHFLTVTLLASPVEGDTPGPGDDLSQVGWFRLDTALPEMAFIEDVDAIRRVAQFPVPTLPVDPGFVG